MSGPGVLSHWFLVYTKPRLEAVAKDNLAQQGFEVYLPLYKNFKKNEHGAVAIFEPMFPRYVFFRLKGSEQSLATVRSTRGVNNLVRFGFEPARIEDDLLSQIRSLEIIRNEVTASDVNSFQIGQSVFLKHNALRDVRGFVQSVGAKRIAVLLEILGRSTVVQVQHHQLESY